VWISISDNGIGIPAKEHSRIFQKFYRVDERLARDVEGSGLGLAIVRHIALGHGGRVELESEPGRGSTFTIVIPRMRPDAVAAAQVDSEALAR
jgi:signal transduction histidine kinase